MEAIRGRKTVVQLEQVNRAIVAAVERLGLKTINTDSNRLVINVSDPEKENSDIVDAIIEAGSRIQFVTELHQAYNIPGKIGLVQLAEQLNLALSTLDVHLRRAERRLMYHIMNES